MRSFLHFSLGLTMFALLGSVPAAAQPQQDQTAALPFDPQIQSQIGELAGRILSSAHKAKCKAKHCTIPVTNFTDTYVSTSLLGMRLADATSAQLAIQAKDIQITDRNKLQAFLQQERIPSNLLEDDPALAWLASRFSASAVLVGILEKKGTGVELRIRLLNVQDLTKKDHKQNFTEEMTFSLPSADGLLVPAEPSGGTPRRETASSNEAIYMSGKDGTSLPSCDYHPSPAYLDEARAAKFSGTIVLEGTIQLDQSVSDIRVIRGAPFGLNDSARQTLETWKCRPATRNGTPVVTRVPIEVSFRLY